MRRIIDIVKKTIRAINAVEEAELSHSQILIDLATQLVGFLPDGSVKRNLLSRIAELDGEEPQIGEVQLIQVPAHNVLYVNERGSPYKLLDEPLPELIADPMATAVTVVNSGPAVPAGSIKTWQDPTVRIYLGGLVNLKRVWVWDGAGTQTHTIRGGDNAFSDTEIGTIVTSGFNVWKKIDIDVNVKWISINLHANYILPHEIAIIGAPLEALNHSEPTPIPYDGIAKSFDQVLGENTFIDVDTNKVAVKRIREYENVRWFWDEATNSCAFAPAVAGGGQWNFDTYFEDLISKGIEIWPCLKENLPALNSSIIRDNQGNISYEADGVTPRRNHEYKPLNSFDADPRDPESYSFWADIAAQFVMRYGSTEHPESSLNLRSDQQARSGLGYIKYVEMRNEPEKTWQDEEGYSGSYEFAAFMSKTYDTLKAVDPEIKIVFGGTAGFRYDYIRLFIEACKIIRGNDSLPFDVMAHHHYGSDAGDQHSNTTATRSVHPIEDNLLQRTQQALLYRDKYYPGKEYGINEYGNDVNPGSPYSADASDMWTAEEKSSIYNLESALTFHEVGYQFADHFMIRDTDTGGNGVFQTTGALGKKALGYPLKHWYFAQKTFVEHLFGFFFTSRIVDNGVLTRIYDHPDGRRAFVVSSPTDSDTVISNHTIHVGEGYLSSYLVQVVRYRDTGMSYGVDIVDGSFSLNVNELHQILVVNPETVQAPLAPSNLVIVDSGETTLDISFNDNDNYEKGYVVEVSEEDESNYVEFVTIPGGSVSTTLQGLNENTYYYVRVKAYNNAGSSDYSNSVLAKTVKSGVAIIQTEQFNFTNAASGAVGWTDVIGSPSTGVSGSSNGIMVKFIVGSGSTWTAANSSGGTGSDLIPDPVQSWYYYTVGDRGDIEISGFDSGQFATITIYSMKAFDGADKTANWTINGVTIPLNAALNTDKLVVFNTIEPDENGKILIQGFKAIGSGSVVINALKIEIGI